MDVPHVKTYPSPYANEDLTIYRSESSSPRTDNSLTTLSSSKSEKDEEIMLRDENGKTSSKSNNKRKRKSYYIRKYAFPKLLKRDIRWDIPRMITNVLNMKNEGLVESFFRRMCYPTCPYVDVVPKNLEDLRPVVYDIDSLIGFLNIDLSVFPDLTFDMKRAEIVQNVNMRGSKIVLYYEMKGTKLFSNSFDRTGAHCLQLEGDKEIAEKLKIVQQECKSIEEFNVSEVVHVDYSREDHEPLPQPVFLQSFPRLSIVLNEQNVVCAIEYALTPGTDVIVTEVTVPP